MLVFLEWFADKRPVEMLDHPCYGPRFHRLPQYALGEAALAPYRAMLIGTHHDQRHLAAQQAVLTRYLDGGGTIVFCGHVVYPFLAGLGVFRPSGSGRLADLRVRRAAEHPLFAGVEADDLTFRRGVAGFYGRGGSDPPTDALVLNTVGEDALAVDWLWRRPQGGRLLLHSGNDMWMHWHDDTTAARIGPQLLDWLLATDGAPV